MYRRPLYISLSGKYDNILTVYKFGTSSVHDRLASSVCLFTCWDMLFVLSHGDMRKITIHLDHPCFHYRRLISSFHTSCTTLTMFQRLVVIINNVMNTVYIIEYSFQPISPAKPSGHVYFYSTSSFCELRYYYVEHCYPLLAIHHHLLR